ncbi:MAG TPA: hypothetical protein VLA34_14755, partial [Candidatus Krumholzibacterium sp.]|nr:hypothetical protein [Candidatus Krumholzibacterium sp.]
VCREYLSAVLKEQLDSVEQERDLSVNEVPEGEVLFINCRLLAYGDEIEELCALLENDSVLEKNGFPVIARLSADKAGDFLDFLLAPLTDDSVGRLFNSLKDAAQKGGDDDGMAGDDGLKEWCGGHGVSVRPTGAKLVSYYWQLIGENGKCIVDDFGKNPLRGAAPESELFRGVDLIKEEDILIGADVEVRSGTVLDASAGPIVISDGVGIEPNSIIYGPCFIGSGSIIRGGAKIGNGTSLGVQCRIGGEVGESIISSYTNKQHEGFIGHSYIGSWVNIGAGSCNSDLKNNYSKIRAWNAGRMRETGRIFLGLVTGDHVKIAINTRINTGSVIGFCSNVISDGFPPKFIPSFVWKTEPEVTDVDLEKAIVTAGIMMDRRNVQFSPESSELFRTLNRYCRMSGRNV